MKLGPWQRLRRFLTAERVSLDSVAHTIGLTRKDFEELAKAEKLPREALNTMEKYYGLRAEYVLSGKGPISIQAEELPHMRLAALRKELGLNQTDFASGIGLTQSGLSSLELGVIPLRRMMALAIEAAYSVRHQWLLYGKLPQKTDHKNTPIRLPPDEQRLLDRYRTADKDVRRVITKLLECTSENKDPWDGANERRAIQRRTS